MKAINPDISLSRDYQDRFVPSESLEVPRGDVIVAIERSGLLACAEMLAVCLEGIEEWEFDTRVDVLPEDALTVIEHLKTVAQD
ncbi:hypothetical protein G7067_06840 [Leucobacter insecticola]|uniref:Uncharacterized protein n=1 Tax=Leucobacter insecticola TaxID=2714934 RepID=A0A6G8FIM4_9MICO|nr:hypothetical protein [Leucobacter insecticola]QIM16201.1 hypothetical protein G7067_06840 [Leucobacter insecticola]